MLLAHPHIAVVSIPCCDHAEVAVVVVVVVAAVVTVVAVEEGDECNDDGCSLAVVAAVAAVVAVIDGTVVSSLPGNGSDEFGIDAGGAGGTTTTGSCTGDVPCLALAYAGARS